MTGDRALEELRIAYARGDLTDEENDILRIISSMIGRRYTTKRIASNTISAVNSPIGLMSNWEIQRLTRMATRFPRRI
jgi:hypothetical protein